MIKVGAFRVSPQEIEEVIAALDGRRRSRRDRRSRTNCSARRSRPSSSRVPACELEVLRSQGALPPAPRHLQGPKDRRVRGGSAAHVLGQSSTLQIGTRDQHMTSGTASLDARVLDLDGDKAVDASAVACARSCAGDLSRRGFVVAMSGGIDSSVCAALAVKALGPQARLRTAAARTRFLGLQHARAASCSPSIWGFEYEIHDIARDARGDRLLSLARRSHPPRLSRTTAKAGRTRS